jgi:hypothetical protein
MRTHRIDFTLACLLLLLSACSRNPAAGETNPSATPTLASPGLSSLPPSREPSQSSTPAATNTPMEPPPASGLNPSGPYVVFEGDRGIWIANPDGSFPTRISENGIGNDGRELRAAISPGDGDIAAVVTGKTGVDLALIEVPSGRTRILSRLVDITRNELAMNSMTPEAFAYYAITGFPNPAWQPGSGDILAYVGAGDGDTADLFAYDLTQGTIRQIEADPSQAISPVWSPHGEYLLYFGVEWLPPFGATYITFDPMKGFWGARMGDNRILPQTNLRGTYRNFAGWQDDTHYLVYDTDEECFAHNLRAVDLLTGGESSVADFCFFAQPVWSPSSGAVLVSVDAGCDCWTGEGVYLIRPDLTKPVRLSDKKALELYWLPESGVFYAYPETLFSADGRARYDPPVRGSSYRPAVSISGHQAWVVIEDHRSRVMVHYRDGSWMTVLEGDVGTMIWDPVSGETLLIVLDTGALYAASAPDFIPEAIDNLAGYYDQSSWTPAPG